jgi:hypothetical protein
MSGYDLAVIGSVGAIVIGLYYAFESLTYRWLGVERGGLPLPAAIRWTIFIGAIVCTPIVLGLLVLLWWFLVGHSA